VKGFSLNAEGTQYLNYQLMRDNVLKEIQQPVINPTTGQVVPGKHIVRRSHRLVRDPKNFTIKTVAEEKRYQMVFEKHVVDPQTFQTYPYGYGRVEMDSQNEEDINTLLDL